MHLTQDGGVFMENEKRNKNIKNNNILIHSLQGTTTGSITLQELIAARQEQKPKNEKGDD